ncbi:hypothetical protein B0H21DRAFT_699603, partial [Amylocystis lapponica]
LLFWIPPYARAELQMWPRNSVILGARGVTGRLDMSTFFHGTSWQKCYNNNHIDVSHTSVDFTYNDLQCTDLLVSCSVC